MFGFLLRIMPAASGIERDDSEKLSRRRFLAGAVIGTAIVSSHLGVSEARAAPSKPDLAPEHDEDPVELAQARRDDRGDRRRDDRGRRRRDDRGRRRDDRGRRRDDRRFSRRDLERQCRRSNKFRRNNRRLCNRVTGRNFGRRGACLQIGPLTVCE